MKLKQSDRRGFSARSTGAIDSKGLPTRSYKSRAHLERANAACIRFGEFETLNFSIAIIPEDIALFHALYRTSVHGRKDLVKLMFQDNENDEAVEGTIDSSYTSRVAEIFDVVLKSLSIKIDFTDEDNELYPLDTKTVRSYDFNGQNYMCTEYQFFLMKRLWEIEKEILEVTPLIETKELTKRAEALMKERDYIMGPLKEELEEIDISNEVKEEYEKFVKQLAEGKNPATEETKESSVKEETLPDVEE